MSRNKWWAYIAELEQVRGINAHSKKKVRKRVTFFFLLISFLLLLLLLCRIAGNV